MSAREHAAHVFVQALTIGATVEEAEQAARIAYTSRKRSRA